MARHKVSHIAPNETDTTLVEQGLANLDYEMNVYICKSHGETIEAVKGADVIINQGVPMPREVIEEIDATKAIVNMGHGFDDIDHEAATDMGVMVVNTAGFCSEEVSNHTIMLLLACAKKLTTLHNQVRAGKWSAGVSPMDLGIPPVYGQLLGLVGLGNISRATARKAKIFGLDVIAHDPYVRPWEAKEHGVELVPDLNELASRSDFISINVPLDGETRKLIGGPFFKAMKQTAYFINTSRGGTVDEQALVRALQDGEIAGAGLDVFEQEPPPADNPLLKMDNVTVTPHSASASEVAEVTGVKRLGEEAARVLSGMWPMSLVNPAVRAKIPMRPAAVNR